MAINQVDRIESHLNYLMVELVLIYRSKEKRKSFYVSTIVLESLGCTARLIQIVVPILSVMEFEPPYEDKAVIF